MRNLTHPLFWTSGIRGPVSILTIFLVVSLGAAVNVEAQDYDLLLKGGHLIDPKNGIDSPMDVAVKDGKIARVAAGISEGDAERVVDVSGLYISPGFIDLHTHIFFGTDPHSLQMNSYRSVQPDNFSFKYGVTTMVDAGSSGWRNFQLFKDQTIAHSRTRVLAFLRITGHGNRGGIYSQNLNDMDPRMTALVAGRHPEVVGVKIAHFRGQEWRTSIERLVEAGTLADIPVVVDFGGGRPPIEELFMELLRPGDIFTHIYHPGPHKEPVVDENGRVKPFVFDAQERGIIFDVGHGGGSFVFDQAIPAIEQGLLPNTISSDLHVASMNAGMKNMANVLSKFLNMGMTIQDVILRSTWNPAKAIQRTDLGHLSEGADADIVVFNLKNGDFGLVDARGWRLDGTQKLEAELTLRAGQIEWDLNGISATAWDGRRGERTRAQ